ncbi:MAG TPA: ATP-dependent helicase [Chthoniobacterales bacterium]
MRYTLETPPAHRRIAYDRELNEQQLAAVTSKPGAALVIAGAGSGKTRTLTYRVAWLLEQGFPPYAILLLTFTNKAAREMLDRVNALLPEMSAGIWGGTFHSIGNRILRRHAERIGFRPGFSILDREDSEDLLEAVVVREGIRANDKRFPKGSVLAELFSLAINTGQPLARIIATRYRYFTPLLEPIERVQAAYEGRKREANSMDFDDLLSKLLELFETHPDVREHYQNQFRQILVDEYQDTNRLQAELIARLAGKHGNLMVVGDDAQSIYSWRGADCLNILEFPKHYPGARVFKIETNYRSVPEVLELANASITGNLAQFEKALRPVRAEKRVRPGLVKLGTNNQQAAFAAQRVLELHEEGIAFSEMAVLYRSHFHSMEVQLEFTRRGIPYTITSGLRFFEQAHVKDVAAFLRFAVNPRDEMSFKRFVKLLPGVGGKSAEALWEKSQRILEGGRDFARLLEGVRPPAKAAEGWKQLVHTLEELVPNGEPAPPAEMIQSVVLAIYDDYMRTQFANYEARREDLQTLASYSKSFASAEEFLSQLALLGALETADATASAGNEERVTLSSIHQAKGLEWQVVFLIWLTEGMFPSSRSVENPESLEEERRLFYVGVTRCKDELYLTYPEMRLNAGYGDVFQRPSRFLEELPRHLLEPWEVESGIRASLPEWGE